MVACSERQRVRGLLAEAVTMLCKSSLQYKFGFSIEGLLGITIDNNQVLLINLHEEVRDRAWTENNVLRTAVAACTTAAAGPIDLRTTSLSQRTDPPGTGVTDAAQPPTDCSLEDSLPPTELQALSAAATEGLEPVCLNSSVKTMELSNGGTSAKRRKGVSSGVQPAGTGQVVVVKKEHSPSCSPTHYTTTPHQVAHEVIYIKDEEDSESSRDTLPEKQPRTTAAAASTCRRKRNRRKVPGPSVTSPPGCEVADTSGIDDQVGKMEEDSLSSTVDTEAEHSPAWREVSPPPQVTYEAGTWAEEQAARIKTTSTTSAHTTRRATQSGPEMRSGKEGRGEATTREVRGGDNRVGGDSVRIRKGSPVNTAHGDPPEKRVRPPKTAKMESRTEDPSITRESSPKGDADPAEWGAADMPRRPRASYSTAYKLMVVRKAIESGNMRATARRFGIHFKQVWQWTRNKEKLLAMSLSALRSPRLWPQTEGGAEGDGPPPQPPLGGNTDGGGKANAEGDGSAPTQTSDPPTASI